MVSNSTKKNKKEKKHKKAKETIDSRRTSKKSKKRKKSSSSSSDSSSESESSHEKKKHKHKKHKDSKKDKKSKKQRRSSSISHSLKSLPTTTAHRESSVSFYETRQASTSTANVNESVPVYGPEFKPQGPSFSTKELGKALLPGEGAAMAAFVSEGKRIPRRGEIGLTSEEIESFEDVGFVMSGSRYGILHISRTTYNFPIFKC